LDIWNKPSEYLNGTAPLNVTSFVTACSQTTCSEKSDWDSFLWYDELHPSEQADRIVAEEFIKVVEGGSRWVKYWEN
jgi:phospholipase/lecithinase/hemolysin